MNNYGGNHRVVNVEKSWRSSKKVPLIARKLPGLLDDEEWAMHSSGAMRIRYPHTGDGTHGLRTKQIAQRKQLKRDSIVAGGATAVGSVAGGVSERKKMNSVKKGVYRQGVIRPIARVNPTKTARRTVHAPKDIIGKAVSPKSALTSVRGFGSGMKNGIGLGRTGAKQSSNVLSRGGQMGEKIGVKIGQNPGKSALAASAGTAGAMKLGEGQRKPSLYAPPQPMYGGFGKRTYDPEDERRFRLGAGAAASGIGGGALLNSARRNLRTDSQAIRNLPDVKDPSLPKKPAAQGRVNGKMAELSDEKKAKNVASHAEAMERFHQQGKHASALRSLKGRRGFLVTPKSGPKIGGGLALLGASGAMLGSRREPRWD